MQNLTSSLKKATRGAKRIAVLGVGSELRGDDWAGMAAAELIDKAQIKDAPLKVFFGFTAPENLTGEIKKFKPTHLVIIDCGDLGKKPGEVALITPEQEIFGASFSTHKLPIKVLVEYINKSFPCKTAIIVIQPKTLEFGKEMSPEARAAAKEVAGSFLSLYK